MFLDLVREVTNGEKLASGENRYNCPFCFEEKHKLYIQEEYPYLWHCKHCDRSGNPITFVKELYSVDFLQAKDILEDYEYYIDDTEKTELKEALSSNTELTEAEQLYLLLDQFSKGQHEEYSNSQTALEPVPLPEGTKRLITKEKLPESFPYINYLLNRGISLYEMEYYGIMYLPNGVIKMPQTGKEVPIANSLVFPTYNDEGQVVYWNTRSIEKDPYIKAINAPEFENSFSKKNTIFNLDKAKKTGNIVISEGVLNAISTGNSGVATFGKQITDEQVQLLEQAFLENKNLNFYIFLDYDAKNQALELAKRIYVFSPNIYLVVNPYGNMDANDMGKEKALELISSAKRYYPGSGSELQLILS